MHTFLKPGEPSRINRDMFDQLRRAYWSVRAKDFDGAAMVGQAAPGIVRMAPQALSVISSVKAVWDEEEGFGDFIVASVQTVIHGDENAWTADEVPATGDISELSQDDGLGQFSLMVK